MNEAVPAENGFVFGETFWLKGRGQGLYCTKIRLGISMTIPYLVPAEKFLEMPTDIEPIGTFTVDTVGTMLPHICRRPE